MQAKGNCGGYQKIQGMFEYLYRCTLTSQQCVFYLTNQLNPVGCDFWLCVL
jgi:hypothetical protein